MCWPAYGTIIAGTEMPSGARVWSLPVNVILHEVPADATASHLRVCWWDNCPSAWRRTTDIGIPLDAHRDGSRSFTLPLDLSVLPSGSHEFRISYEIHYTLNGTAREQFQSTGLQVCIRTCDGPDRTLPWTEARGWYSQGHDYANARLRSDPSCLRRGGVCNVEMIPGSGGSPTVLAVAALDASYHAGNGGREVLRRAGEYRGPITIPADLAPGLHRLSLISSDGKNAVNLLLQFEVH